MNKKAAYNQEFWDYLNYYLKKEFGKTDFNYKWVYPIEFEGFAIFEKGKINDFGILNASILFQEENEEKECLTEIVLGKYSSKAYLNSSNSDLTKCYPKSDFSEWIKVDKLNNKITILLK